MAKKADKVRVDGQKIRGQMIGHGTVNLHASSRLIRPIFDFHIKDRNDRDVQYRDFSWSNEVDIVSTDGYTLCGLRNILLTIIDNGVYHFGWERYFTGYYPNGNYAYPALWQDKPEQVVEEIRIDNVLSGFYTWIPENWNGNYDPRFFPIANGASIVILPDTWHL